MILASAGLTLALSGALACSSDSADGPGTGGSGGSGAGACSSPGSLDLYFSPMYSAHDGVHEFKIPAIVAGVSGASITWSIADPSMAAFVNDPNTGGILITTLKPGTTKVQAQAPDGRCGSADLVITGATAAEWEAGNTRYNNGQPLAPISLAGGVPMLPADGSNLLEAGGLRPACTNCHGVTGQTQIFQSVSHTPQQTGGFSDEQLTQVFTSGVIPPGGYYDPSVIPQQVWSFFHKWTVTPEEAKGLVVYLRSLTPKSQGAMVDFSGVLGNRGGAPAAGSGGAVGAGGSLGAGGTVGAGGTTGGGGASP